mmetsp:Transcript_55010/g.91627  ORF Transcript_55010/g.91627 Transcript_55010/m.91627 type:complete len:93 (+) Transcript_55010:43-321(+)
MKTPPSDSATVTGMPSLLISYQLLTILTNPSKAPTAEQEAVGKAVVNWNVLGPKCNSAARATEGDAKGGCGPIAIRIKQHAHHIARQPDHRI